MTINAGLENVVACQTSISFIDGIANPSILEYRGYPAAELARSKSFEDVVHLLLEDELPSADELSAVKARLGQDRPLPENISDYVRGAASSGHSMDVLLAAVALSQHDPQALGPTPRQDAWIMVAQFPTVIATYYRARNGRGSVEPEAGLSHAANYLWMLNGEVPSIELERALDGLLTLYAEHELNASTFAVRVAAGTLTTYRSAIIAGLATLKGPLHGGATEDAAELLTEIGRPEAVKAWLDDALKRKRMIPGFGHRVYRSGDARTPIMRELSTAVSGSGNSALIDVALELESQVREAKGLIANVDLYAAALLDTIGFPDDMLTSVVASSRIAGWSAHAIEQYGHNRIIRPRASYVGPLPRHLTAKQA